MDEGDDRKDAIQILVIYCNHPALSFLTRCKLNFIEQRPLVAKITSPDGKICAITKYFSKIVPLVTYPVPAVLPVRRVLPGMAIRWESASSSFGKKRCMHAFPLPVLTVLSG